MSVPSEAAENALDGEASGLYAAAGLFAGFALLALTSAGAVAFGVPRIGLGLCAAHHVFDAAETLGLGALAGAIAAAFTHRSRLPLPGLIAVYAAATAPLQYFALGDDLQRQASVAFEGRGETVLFVVFFFLVSLAVPAAHVVGALLSRFRWLRFLPVTVALAAMIGNAVFLRDDYFGLHASVAWTAATLAGAALAPLAYRAARSLARARGGRVVLATLAAVSLFGLVVPPPSTVRVELFKNPTALAPWVLAATVWPTPRTQAAVAPSAWLGNRSGTPPIPPTAPRLFSQSPVVVLITVDAMRADPVLDPRNDIIFPNFAAMKARGVTFRNAVAAGSQTAVSLTALFSSHYFSELFWSMHGEGSSRFVYAADDPSPRFPAILGMAGVSTASFDSLNFMAGEFGVARGFREERVIPTGRRHAFATQMIDALVERLNRVSAAEPFFGYTHLMEPHAPYDRGRHDGTDWEKYLSEIAVADREIGRVLALLEHRFAGRWILVISADHGEAFGEHGTFQHTKTLYDELLHVPLLVAGAGISGPRTVDDRVGLIDLGPTMLDLFGIPTPATFEGQSLVPLLSGRSSTLTRPVCAEGRLRRALWMPDGMKVIEDLRRATVEAYDVTRDPGELRNLVDAEPDRAGAALATLRAFFDAHQAKRPGYQPPYKP